MGMTALPLMAMERTVVTERTVVMGRTVVVERTMMMERTVETKGTVVMGTVRRAMAVGATAKMEMVMMTMGIRSLNAVA